MLTPLMKPREWEFMKPYLKKDMVMLEYGSGQSTQIFAKLVQTLYSIEHHTGWYTQVQPSLVPFMNVNYIHIPPNDNSFLPYGPSKPEWFEDYINWPKKQSQMFDIVFIDGRARQYVAESVIDNITSDSLVFLHDYTNGWPEDKPAKKRPRYDRVLEFYDIVDAVHTLALLKKK